MIPKIITRSAPGLSRPPILGKNTDPSSLDPAFDVAELVAAPLITLVTNTSAESSVEVGKPPVAVTTTTTPDLVTVVVETGPEEEPSTVVTEVDKEPSAVVTEVDRAWHPDVG